jgi:hypothetical protein
MRDDRVYHQSKKYIVKNNTNISQYTKISFQEGELMQTELEYLKTKMACKNNWSITNFTIYVIIEGSSGKEKIIGEQKVNLFKYVDLYWQ